MLARSEFGCLLQVDLLQIIGCTDDRLGPRVADDPLDLIGRGRLVDGDGGAPGSPDGVVEHGELVARGGEEAHSVPLLEPKAHEAGCDPPDGLGKLGHCDVDEGPVAFAVGTHDVPRLARLEVPESRGEVLGRVDRDGAGAHVLLQAAPPEEYADGSGPGGGPPRRMPPARVEPASRGPCAPSPRVVGGRRGSSSDSSRHR